MMSVVVGRLMRTVLAMTLGVLAGGLVFGGAPALAAAPEAPVTISPANAITATSATLEGILNPGVSAKAGWYFAYSTEATCAGAFTTAQEPEVEGKALTEHAEVTGLEPSKKYTFCLVATNEAGEFTQSANEVPFTTLSAKPSVDSESASAVKSTEATLEAQVNPNNQKTSGYLQYATTATVDGSGSLIAATKTASSELGEAFGDQPVAPPALTGLTAGETYYYQAVATNATGTTYGTVQEFTTVPTPHTDPVTAITATTATFNGHLTLNPLDTTVTTQFSFDYNPSATECINSQTTPAGEAGTGTGLVHELTEVTELQPNQLYSVCFATSNVFGSEVDTTLPLVQFKTLVAAPRIDSETASAVTPVEATLEAQVNPNNQKTSGYLQYSTTATVDGNGSLTSATKTSVVELGEAYGDQPVGPVALTGLTAGTTYYYQAVATNATGTTNGTVQSFTTQGAPLVTTGEAQNITRTTATFSGTVNPVGVETTYYFEYISEAGYQAAEGTANPYAAGETTTPISAGSSYATQAVGPIPGSGLLPGKTYHYALVASNTVGVTIGHDETFKTLPPTPPIVLTGGVSGVSQNTATLSGTIATNSLQTNYGFEIGTEVENYGPATGLGSLGGTATEAVTLTLGELQPGTTYYYRVTATNADGTSKGEPETFTTPGFPTLLTAPSAPPLIATPAIGFPTGSLANTGSGEAKKLTNAQKLAAALKACKKQKSKSKRANCEKQARKKYAPAGKKRKR
jgi:hypothetical protein